MISGLYPGASGMMAQMHCMVVLSNNLANVDVTGYKKDASVSSLLYFLWFFIISS